MCRASNDFSAFLWSLNVFFAIAMIRSYEVHLQSEKHLQTHCNFKFWICSSSFLDMGHDASCVKWFFIISMITQCLFCACYDSKLWSSVFIKNMPASSLQLQILNLLKQFFRRRAWRTTCQTIFQCFYDYSMPFCACCD